ncbi:unnamed protein product [Lactuca saligna]|uniref:Receptor-like serine/threonine-protein kinase n=1 Tax=Lactuca saligna TaxID=75948 RepID=A0AA35YGD2_LACSI|nr:unnamed protein product [Lactuca saligna]
MEILHYFLFLGLLMSDLGIGRAQDTIAANQTLREGDTLVSADEMYELGFFSLGNITKRYLGIWYKNKSPLTVAWVANRETPITDLSGVFRVHTNGSLLVIAGSNNTTVWSSNPGPVSPTTRNPVAQLLNPGNLVVRDQSGEGSFIWQSFDHPGDMFLPGIKLGKDLVSGLDRRLSSWKSLDDPSPGLFEAVMNTNGYPQLWVERDSVPYSRFGPWNGVTFNGIPSHISDSIFTQDFVMNDKEVYYWFKLVNSSVVTRIYFSPEGIPLRMNWNERTQMWFLYSSANIDMCSLFALCGSNGKCDPQNTPLCSCMEGFEPRNPDEWSASQWSSGCRRRTALSCPNGDGFRVFKNVKLPDTRRAWFNRSMTLGECETACKQNCSCNAYSNMDIRMNGSGCLLWFDDLMDIRTVEESQDLFVRMAVSDLTTPSIPGFTSRHGSNKKRQTIIVVVSILSIVVMVILILAILNGWRKKKRSQVKIPVQTIDEEYIMESQDDDTELKSFGLTKIWKSTNDFANDKKLGEGGFGPVYKGVLDDEREIAVKRLSKTSRQGDEKMLIYEYMPNKSLDSFIFDKIKSSILGWSDRFHIIHGIARGLLYLHQDSRFKIVHRDLKTSNILLDGDMNPKISDFGLARMFREHENEANTNNVVGTLGYIAPEYAVDGIFSEKSDVFSFGVLVLEIVSGKKNRGFSHQNDSDNLLAHAWRLFEGGMAMELLAAHMHESCVASEVLRSIHIGLLCAQHFAKDRPTMSSVVLMFDKEGALPQPKQPAFFAKGSLPQLNLASVNDITMTTLEPR